MTSLSARLLLNRTLRVSLTDGRTLTGTFALLDPEENIILTAARERPPPREGEVWRSELDLGQEGEKEREEGRWVGMVMVPGRLVKTLEIREEAGGWWRGGLA